jgi:hypothetical protein
MKNEKMELDWSLILILGTITHESRMANYLGCGLNTLQGVLQSERCGIDV